MGASEMVIASHGPSRRQRALDSFAPLIVDIPDPEQSAEAAPLTWEQLVAAEPRLALLEQHVRGIARQQQRKPNPHYCSDAVWHGWRQGSLSIKACVAKLAGWGRRGGPDLLQTPAAYDVASRHIYQQL